jgi:hypothetical protein
MPVSATVAYPTVEAVMNRARAYVNDAYQGGAGRILTDSAPFSIEYLNGALENLQDMLRDYEAVSLIKDNYIMSPIAAIANVDPSVQINVSFTGFFNGVSQVALPTLPADMLVPLFLWERTTGANLPFSPMEQPQSGLPSYYQGQSLRFWEWRNDAIWMMGSQSTEDLRLRYKAQLLPIAAPSTQAPWSGVSIVIQASVEALAHLVAYRYARARGSQMGMIFKADADDAKRSIMNRYVLQSQGSRHERVPYNRDDGGWKTPGLQ